MTAYDALATEYDAGRIGYSNDVYNTLVGYGLHQRCEILDIGCGSGLASRPLIENAFRVTGVDESDALLALARQNLPAAKWVKGRAEKLPFPDQSFDVVISAQAFHHFDREAAMREIVRVLRPGGIVGIWWKYVMSDDPTKVIAGEIIRGMGKEPPISGLKGGFKEFYAAELADHTLRVIPWRSSMLLSQYMSYERSRKIIRDTLASQAAQYFTQLEARLHEQYGEGDPLIPVAYMHYLYLGKKP